MSGQRAKGLLGAGTTGAPRAVGSFKQSTPPCPREPPPGESPSRPGGRAGAGSGSAWPPHAGCMVRPQGLAAPPVPTPPTALQSLWGPRPSGLPRGSRAEGAERTGSAHGVWAAAQEAPSGGVPLPSAALANAGRSGPPSGCAGGRCPHCQLSSGGRGRETRLWVRRGPGTAPASGGPSHPRTHCVPP